MTTVSELKNKALKINKHMAAASSDIAWDLTFEEIKSLDIQSVRFTTKIARYEKEGNEETLTFLRHMVAGAIAAA